MHGSPLSAGLQAATLASMALSAGYSHAMKLTNETHISKGFVVPHADPLM